MRVENQYYANMIKWYRVMMWFVEELLEAKVEPKTH